MDLRTIKRSPFISIYTTASSQWCPKLHQYCHIARSPDLNPPDFYLWGYLKDNVWEQSSNNWWTEGSNHSKDQGNPIGGMCASHWQFCATYASMPSRPRMLFGAHFGKNIKIICKLTQMTKTLWKFKSTKFEEIW
jgi:hypothetical protein